MLNGRKNQIDIEERESERVRERGRESTGEGMEGGKEEGSGGRERQKWDMGEIIKTMRGSEGASEPGANGEGTDGGWGGGRETVRVEG